MGIYKSDRFEELSQKQREVLGALTQSLLGRQCHELESKSEYSQEQHFLKPAVN